MPVWSEQERMVADSAAAFFEEAGGVARVRGLKNADGDGGILRAAARQGWIGLLVPEALGGLGMEMREAVALMRTAGKFLPPEPFASAIACAQALAWLPDRKKLLDEVLAGSKIALTAPVETQADGRLVSRPMAGLDAADVLFAVDLAGRWALMERGDTRMSVESWPTRDGGSMARAVFQEAALGPASHRFRADLADTAILLQAAELVGIGSEAFERTIAYLETRNQFGAPLSSFQALQQRAATLYVRLAAADALVLEATRAFGGQDQSFAVRGAFARAGSAAEAACKEAIQMHGAIGFTDEHEIGLFLHRTLSIRAARRPETAMMPAMQMAPEDALI